MANGVLGLGAGGGGLNQELIDKLRAAESKSTVAPIEADIVTWGEELAKITDIESKVTEFLTQVKKFDLFSTSANAFEQMTASTTGTAALFDAVDVSDLTPGTVNVVISQLANKDVFQSDAVTEAVKDATLGAETLTIQIGTGTAVDFDTTGKTYQELADEINLGTGLNASVEQVGTDSYRLVIKSSDSGTANALTITGTASQTLGYTEELDPIGAPGVLTEKAANHTLTAQNMQGTVDNVAYDISSNTITIQGNLTMTALELGNSSISIQRDTSIILTEVETFMTLYNELVDLVDAEVLSSDSPISDTSALRAMMSQVKDFLFGEYGASADKNVFSYGMEIDKTGHLSVNTATFADAINNDYDGLVELFIGTAAFEGLGTQLKTFVDDLDGFEGLLTTYGESMADRKTKLDEDLISANEDLDSKYDLMAAQFASYGTVIAQMEAAFGGMKMMIAQSQVSS